jgi:hypothetical protein
MGYVKGTGGGNFSPNTQLNLQDTMTMVYRFAKANDIDVAGRADLSKYTDANQIRYDEAKEAIAWAIDTGLIDTVGNTLAPSKIVSRLEAAVIMERMSRLLKI